MKKAAKRAVKRLHKAYKAAWEGGGAKGTLDASIERQGAERTYWAIYQLLDGTTRYRYKPELRIPLTDLHCMLWRYEAMQRDAAQRRAARNADNHY